MKIHFWPKTEKAENDQIAHFRRRKQKLVSVGFQFDGLTWVTLTPSDFTTDLRHCLNLGPKMRKRDMTQ